MQESVIDPFIIYGNKYSSLRKVVREARYSREVKKLAEVVQVIFVPFSLKYVLNFAAWPYNRILM